jgi:two-component system OmpR family sensor kinase
MTYNTERTGFWESLKRLPQRMPLRTKLITAVLALVAIALAVISVAGLSFLRGYLLDTTDQQLSTLSTQLLSPANNGRPHGIGPDRWVEAFIADGRVVYTFYYNSLSGASSFALPSNGPPISVGASWLKSGGNVTVAAHAGSGKWRLHVVKSPVELTNPATGQSVTGTLVVGIDVTPQYSTIAKLQTVDVVVSVLVLLALGLVGTAVVRASLRPLTDIEQTAGAIAAGDLTRRVPEQDPNTEVGRLGRSLNVMLSQIEAAFDARSESEEAARRSEGRMRQFVADASHELRTPLTAIRGFAEYYRQRGGVRSGPPGPPEEAAVGPNGKGKLAPADLDRIMRRVEQESARMGILVEDMLLLARLDQQRPLDRHTVDLLTLAADAVHDARVVAPDREVNLSVGTGAALLINGDEVRLRQVIGNLMSNALSHTPAGTPIDVHLRPGTMAEIQAATATPAPVPPAGGDHADHGDWPATGQSAAVLEVTDHGPGLSEEQARHAFERFYRADAARTTGGTGLGLAIVAALVAAHGGAVWVRTQPGQGATFAIALPLAPEAVRDPGQDDEQDDVPPEDLRDETDWIDSHSGPAAGSAG